jgi:retron-type reverse transcriptase
VHLRNELLPEPQIFALTNLAHPTQKKGNPVASLVFARLLKKIALQHPQAHECELYNSGRASEQWKQMEIKRELSVAIECSYKQLFDINIYKSAYQQLKSNPDYFTEGTDNETLDGISLEWAQDVINQMKDRNFQFKPSLKVYIKKNNTLTNGKLRPIGIPSSRDIIIQQALRMILESVYEPLFLNTSHGFRPKRSTTTAVYEIKK